MSAKQGTEKTKATPKEKILEAIAIQISTAFPAIKASLGEKKFEKRIKKAGKLLVDGIKFESKSGVQEKAATAQKVKKASAGIPKKAVKTTPKKLDLASRK
ncbi:MAG: hypothetical protein WKI04_03090 [Ferruginibacter sp.]